MIEEARQWLDRAEPRALVLGFSGAMLLWLALLGSYVVWPEYQRLIQANESLAVLSRVGEGGADLKMQLSVMTDDVAELSQRLHGDMAELPPEQMEAYIVGRLQRVSWQTGVDLVGVRPAAGQTVHQFSESVFTVQIQARYSDFVHWLRQMHSEVGFIVVKKYRIRPIDDDWGDPKLDVMLSLAAYRMVRA